MDNIFADHMLFDKISTDSIISYDIDKFFNFSSLNENISDSKSFYFEEEFDSKNENNFKTPIFKISKEKKN